MRLIDDRPAGRSGVWAQFEPKFLTRLKQGYDLALLRGEALAGLQVAVVALPLAMALAIASGAAPEKGLVTAVVAGFLISFLGGSRVQIGGPTGAFVVIVYSVIERHGYDGLILATLMAGVFLLIFAAARLGSVIRYVPYPVVTGFTSGIAVIIFSSQIRDLFGLQMAAPPGEFLAKWEAYVAHAASWSPAAVAVAGVSLAVIIAVRRYKPTLPGFLLAVLAGTALAQAFGLPAETLGARFGEIPAWPEMPALPEVTVARLVALAPDALTIALLAGIESLLSAMIADGMTGGRHRSNAELMGQGVANIASGLVGGLPATGAIARTVTNIKSGGRTPLAGMLHAVFLLGFMLLLAPLLVYVPLASLAAVLVIVAWNMSEVEHFRHLLKGPRGDALVLVATFLLTVLVDLTVAIQVGIVLAALLFMRRMTEVTEVGIPRQVLEPDVHHPGATTRLLTRDDLPPGVEVFQINGPFFFGVATRLQHVLDSVRTPPKVFILRMRRVPMIDASGVRALEDFIAKCRRQGTRVVVTGVNPQPAKVLAAMNFDAAGHGHLVDTLDDALRLARELSEGKPDPASTG